MFLSLFFSRFCKTAIFFLFLEGVGIFLFTAIAAVPKFHSFEIDSASVQVCLNGALFTGGPTFISAVNIPMTPEVREAFDSPVIATGNSYTFTQVGERFEFQISYPKNTFITDQEIIINATEIPGSILGFEGAYYNTTVSNCLLTTTVPAMSEHALFVLTLLIIVAAFLATKKYQSAL